MRFKNPKNKENANSGQGLHAKSWQSDIKAKREPFPGPEDADVPLRIAMKGEPYADVIEHIKGSLDKEVCGVLVGHICKDERGLYTYIQAAVRGNSVKQGSQHVTYTQETWNEIHRTIDEKYPDMSIVGWYHSHPGFGVQFSDMDKFIQNNFFNGAEQFGLVMDPLSSDIAVIINSGKENRHIGRFWVDGGEHRCWVPPSTEDTKDKSPYGVNSSHWENIDRRLTHVIHAIDENTSFVQKSLVFALMVISTAVILWIGMSVWKMVKQATPTPPKENIITVPVPIDINGKKVLLQMQVSQWKIPDEINPLLLQEREFMLRLNEVISQTRQETLLEYDRLLVEAESEEDLKQIIEHARKRVAHADNLKISAENTREKKALSGKILLILLWTMISVIIFSIGVFVIKRLRSAKR